MTFKQAVQSIKKYSVTNNGAKTHDGSGDPCVDFFFLAGASRNVDVTTPFAIAFGTNQELAVRIALWMRDCRGGAGERDSFRKVVQWLSENGHYNLVTRILPKIPELGRWDDLPLIPESRAMINAALRDGNGLCAKWMPRQGAVANFLRGDLTPRQWRKLVVGLSNTVEQKMCAQLWNDIVFKHVPSLAAARYQNAFKKHCAHYEEYKKALVKGEETVHASVIFPHDVIKAFNNGDKVVAQAQWNSLPNYIPADSSILPVVDVSDSMTCAIGGTTRAIDVSLALGIYCADKNKGAFKDLVCTFSNTSELYELKGGLAEKMSTLVRMKWGMNTNLQAAFQRILVVAQQNKVLPQDMPKTLLVLSDMEFDQCITGDTNFKTMKYQYQAYGYEIPNVVFWNLNGRVGNSPVRAHKSGAALISGFSPAILKSVLSYEDMSPHKIMMDTVSIPRYSF